MKRSNLIYLFLILISGPGFAQGLFRYKRNISGVEQEGWYALALPPPLYKHLNPGFTDIRLYRAGEADSLELPYLLDVMDEEVTSETVQLPLLNKSVRDGALYLTFQLQPQQQVNSLDLEFFEFNYFGFVTMEGSDDRETWFEIARDERIVAVKSPAGDYTLSTIVFPRADYRFLRVRVTADVPLTFRAASFQHKTVKAGVYRDVPLTWSMRSDKGTRLSFIDIKLTDVMPLSSITVVADSTGDFYRSCRLEYVRDSTRTDKGWVKYYEPVYEGYITSFTPNKFAFKRTTAKALRLVIMDRDNPPLRIHGISGQGPEVHLLSRLKPGNLFMLYGAESIRPPSYDLAYFENKIPGTPPLAALGPEQMVAAAQRVTSPLFENKVWLWSLMGLMIGGLGFFTLRMMKQKA